MGGPEEFFVATTRGGRTLRLFFEHTGYETLRDDAGELFDSPTDTKITGTLDGAPIDIEAVNWSLGRETATVRTTDQGTFTATTSDDPQDHSDALRRYLEYRPADGWEVAITNRTETAEGLTCTVAISNGRLTERAEFRLSAQVATTLAKGEASPSDEAVVAAVAETVRSDDWPKIQRRAQEPTTLLWRAH